MSGAEDDTAVGTNIICIPHATKKAEILSSQGIASSSGQSKEDVCILAAARSDISTVRQHYLKLEHIVDTLIVTE